jgi:hypothetical protein
MNTLKETLMERDGLNEDEAIESIKACRDDFNARLAAGEMPHDIMEEYFGLEPDYLEEFLF